MHYMTLLSRYDCNNGLKLFDFKIITFWSKVNFKYLLSNTLMSHRYRYVKNAPLPTEHESWGRNSTILVIYFISTKKSVTSFCVYVLFEDTEAAFCNSMHHALELDLVHVTLGESDTKWDCWTTVSILPGFFFFSYHNTD